MKTNSNRWNSIICRVFSQFRKRSEVAFRESPQRVLTHWARSQERSTASAERWVLRAFGISPARDRPWGDHAWGGARGRGGRSYPLASLQPSAPGRPHTAEPGAPGEGVSSGPASQPLPVLLAAPPPAVSRDGAGPRSPRRCPVVPPAPCSPASSSSGSRAASAMWPRGACDCSCGRWCGAGPVGTGSDWRSE